MRNHSKVVGITRRRLLKSMALTTGAAGLSGLGAPTIWAQNIKDITLRQIGGSYSNIAEIASKASQDLGFKIEMQAVDDNTQITRTLTQPTTFDVNDVGIFYLSHFVGKGLLQPVDSRRYKFLDQTVSVFSKGENQDGSKASRQGTAPIKVLYYGDEKAAAFAQAPTTWLSGVPSVYNADTLGIRPSLVNKRIESWAELLNPKFAGKVALVDIPSVGVMDVAMALEAQGQIHYGDKGDMTVSEIDRTIAIMKEMKKGGHFRAFWSTFDQSVNLMASGETIIQSMWSPAVAAVRSRGLDCEYVALKEGFRGWGSVLAPMAHLKGLKLDAYYEYVNWYNSGWVGAFMARQGYYSSVLSTTKAALSAEEWNYWYEGRPAAAEMKDPYGGTVAKSGETRDGGGYWDRMGRIACWNTRMTEDRHLTRRWNEFVSG